MRKSSCETAWSTALETSSCSVAVRCVSVTRVVPQPTAPSAATRANCQPRTHEMLRRPGGLRRYPCPAEGFLKEGAVTSLSLSAPVCILGGLLLGTCGTGAPHCFKGTTPTAAATCADHRTRFPRLSPTPKKSPQPPCV